LLQLDEADFEELGLGYGTKAAWGDTDSLKHYSRGRHKKWIPAWALDDKKTQLVIYNYIWNYCHIYKGTDRKPGTPLQVLEATAKQHREVLSAALPVMTDENKKKWEKHLDATTNGVAATAIRIIYMAYRQGLRSTDIAAELHTTAAAVRIRLWRLNEIARKLFVAEENFPRHHSAGEKAWRRRKRGPQRERVKGTWFKVTSSMRSRPATEKLEGLARRYSAGESLRVLSQETKCAPATLYHRLIRAGLIQPKLKDRLTPEFLADCARRYNGGETMRAIADSVGRSSLTLWDAFRRHPGMLVRKLCRKQLALKLKA
jgi:hypothetical protein